MNERKTVSVYKCFVDVKKKRVTNTTTDRAKAAKIFSLQVACCKFFGVIKVKYLPNKFWYAMRGTGARAGARVCVCIRFLFLSTCFCFCFCQFQENLLHMHGSPSVYGSTRGWDSVEMREFRRANQKLVLFTMHIQINKHVQQPYHSKHLDWIFSEEKFFSMDTEWECTHNFNSHFWF